MILENTLDLLRTRYGSYCKLLIDRVQIGRHLTVVSLSDGSCGVVGTGMDNPETGPKQNRNFGKFTPGNMCGYTAAELFDYPGDGMLLRSLQFAVINAISGRIIHEFDYQIVEDKDPVDLLDLSGQKKICMVGAFQGYMTKLANSGHQLSVLELQEDVFREEHKRFFVPAVKAAEYLPFADIIMITGLTLVNNTIDNLLQMIPPGRQVVVVGPSAGLIPDMLFQYHVNIIGSLRILDTDKLFRIAAEGGAGFHLFQYCARKICILNKEI